MLKMKPIAGSPLERPDCLFTVINQLILERQRRGFITSLGQRPRDIQTQKKRYRRNSCLQPLTISHQPSTQRNFQQAPESLVERSSHLSPITQLSAVALWGECGSTIPLNYLSQLSTSS
jgi:hypothetical protein